MKKGVKPVAQLGVILRLQRTAGSSATHHPANFFNQLRILGLSPCKIMPFAHSTCPFMRGCAPMVSDPGTRDCARGILFLGYGMGHGPRPTFVVTTRSAVGLLIQ
jgi:hypothetical protein